METKENLEHLNISQSTNNSSSNSSLRNVFVLTKRKSYPRPVTVEDGIDRKGLLDTQQPTFKVAPLSAIGYRGHRYSLLVILHELLKLYQSSNKSYAAMMEHSNVGNLDDIIFVVRNRKKGKKRKPSQKNVKAYQVKYFKNPIKVYEFFNENMNVNPKKKISSNDGNSEKKKAKEKESQANKKMHIGKFFDGWLKLKDKYKDIPEPSLRSIVYSNSHLDTKLNKCIEGGKFSDAFIQNKTKVIVRDRKSIEDFKIFKNFLTKLKGHTITKSASTKVWNALDKARYLDNRHLVTKKFKGQDPNFKLEISKNIIPDGISLKQIQELLIDKQSQCNKSKVDLFELLFTQAWKYLENNKEYEFILKLADNKKRELFRRFLKSFEFNLKRPNIPKLESEIQSILEKILKGPSDQVFLCLSYALQEWFSKEYEKNIAPLLTKKIFNDLLKRSQIRANELILLQGHSEAALLKIERESLRNIVPRDEFEQLKKLVETKANAEQEKSLSQYYTILGEKGMGKSTLAKEYCRTLKKSEFLFLPAIDLINNELRIKVSNVLKATPYITVLVIDGAETLNRLDRNELVKFMKECSDPERRIIFTKAIDKYQQEVYLDSVMKEVSSKYQNSIIHCNLLNEKSVIETFPKLNGYISGGIKQFASKPFTLVQILKLNEELPIEDFEQKLKTEMPIELAITQLIIEGLKPNKQHQRRIAWFHLAYTVFHMHSNLNCEVSLKEKFEGLNELIEEGIVNCNNDTYSFKHDLFFEHGLLIYWFQQWEHASIECKMEKFWREFTNLMAKKENAMMLFGNWLLVYKTPLIKSLDQHVNLISKLPCVEVFINFSIITNNNSFLEKLLNNLYKIKNAELKQILNKQIPFLGNTFVAQTILYNKPNALKLLLNYGAKLLYTTKRKQLPVMIENPEQSNDSEDEPPKKKRKLNSDGETDSEQSSSSSDSEDSYDYNKRDSDSEDSYQNEQDNLEESEDEDSTVNDVIDEFIRNPSKGWQLELNENSKEHYLDNSEDDSNFNVNYLRNPSNFPNESSYAHLAVLHKRVECLRIMLKTNKDIALVVNEDKETALHLAVSSDSSEIFNALLESGVNVDVTDQFGETPLHNAVYSENLEAARELLKKGADPNFQNIKTISPCEIALVKLNLEMVKLLMQYGGNFSELPSLFPEDMNVADLLNRVLEEDKDCDFDDDQTAFDDFVQKFVVLLMNNNQTGPVRELMKLIKHCARLSVTGDGFEYWDIPSKFNSALQMLDIKNITDEDVAEYILDDTKRIQDVFSVPFFADLKEEIIGDWLEHIKTIGSKQYIENLRVVIEETNDKILLELIESASTQIKSMNQSESEDSESENSERGSDSESEDSEDASESEPESKIKRELKNTQERKTKSDSEMDLAPDGPNPTSSTGTSNLRVPQILFTYNGSNQKKSTKPTYSKQPTYSP